MCALQESRMVGYFWLVVMCFKNMYLLSVDEWVFLILVWVIMTRSILVKDFWSYWLVENNKNGIVWISMYQSVWYWMCKYNLAWRFVPKDSLATGTVEVQEQAVVSVSYQRWNSVHLLHHQHCFHSSPRNKRFSHNTEVPPKDPTNRYVQADIMMNFVFAHHMKIRFSSPCA